MSEENKTVETVETQDEETKVYTSDEVNAMIEEGKKQAREEAKKNAEKQFQKRLEESKKLSKMSEQEKLEYELEQRQKELDERERDLSLAENRAVATSILVEKGLGSQLVELVLDETAEEMNNKINLLEREFKKAVKEEVNKRLSGNAPKKGLPVDKTITREDFLKMSYSELEELKTNQPELFNQLRNY
jgi:hypothetical protein